MAANVKILEFGYGIIQTIKNEHLANLISKKVQPPHFARLDSSTVVKYFRQSVSVPDEEQLLQNATPMPKVHIRA
uniref:Cyclin-like F-box; Agenet, putative n=1 Tax=Medicago truncatula TaxID=3880 RepID=Q2HS73_MEDTR|nr:Cyclin-like F-box; Agenet, putative [Medicago truncatula]